MAFNYLIKTMYGPLKTALPLSMADLSFGMPRAEEQLKRAESRGEVVPKSPSSPKSAVFSDDVHWNNKALKWVEGEEHLVTSSSDSSSSPDHGSTPEKKPSYSETDPHSHSKDPQYIELAEMGGTKGSPKGPRSHRNTMAEDAEELDEPEQDPEEQYFAVPGGPGVLIHGEEGADDPGAFFHPATKEPQRIIWIPVDELGLGVEQSSTNIAMGVRSSTKHAEMTIKVSCNRDIRRQLTT